MIKTLLRFLLMIVTPFALCGAVITLVIGSWFPNFAYNLPYVTSDKYGFSDEQRLELAQVAVDYLQESGTADETIYLLEEQTFPDSSEPLYTEGEIKHMVDVKERTDQIRIATWIMGLAIFVGLAGMVVSSRNEFFNTIRAMGKFATIFLIVIGLYVVIRWERFFVQFHELFFEDGTWTFSNESSLIRLFPEQFWFTCGLCIVGGTFVGGLLLWLFGAILTKKEK